MSVNANLSTTAVTNTTTAATVAAASTINFTIIAVYMRLIEFPFGMITNFINICVFLNPKLKDTSYTYMLTISITNFFYQSFLFVSYVFMSIPITQSTYFVNLYSIVVPQYLTVCLAIFRIIVEITLSLHTYCILINKNWMNRIPSKVLLPIFFLVSLLVYAQLPFTSAIGSSTDQNGIVTYFQQPTDFGISALAKTIGVINTLLRILLAVLVLTIVNVLNVIEFRKRFNSKRVGMVGAMTTTQPQIGTKGLISFCI